MQKQTEAGGRNYQRGRLTERRRSLPRFAAGCAAYTSTVANSSLCPIFLPGKPANDGKHPRRAHTSKRRGPGLQLSKEPRRESAKPKSNRRPMPPPTHYHSTTPGQAGPASPRKAAAKQPHKATHRAKEQQHWTDVLAGTRTGPGRTEPRTLDGSGASLTRRPGCTSEGRSTRTRTGLGKATALETGRASRYPHRAG